LLSGVRTDQGLHVTAHNNLLLGFKYFSGGIVMGTAEEGNSVKVHYTGKLNDGTVFDSSRERTPIEFTIGKGQLIGGFENALVGMAVNETKTVNIPAAEAYGEHRSELVVDIKKAQFPEDIVPEEGLHLDLKNPEGRVMKAVVTSVAEDEVTIDANHPLAGKDLTFDLELVEIV
jgi:FKBP-type peptidyl-prolyl cis-trans isomerase 2